MKCRGRFCLRQVHHRRYCAKCTLAAGLAGEPLTLEMSDDGELGRVSQGMTDQQLARYHRALVVMVIVSGILAGLSLLVSSAPTMTSFN